MNERYDASRVIAVILIGGSGYRFGGSTLKQFVQVMGKDMFVYTADAFQQHARIDEIVLVCPKGWREYVTNQCDKFRLFKVRHIVEGGCTRQESGYNAVKFLKPLYKDNPVVIEHDGDRVLIDECVISRCIESCCQHGNAWACMNSSDYIVEGTPDRIIGNLRTGVKRQTLRTHSPCAFRLDDLYAIYKHCEDNGIDDMCIPCDIALDMGIVVHPVASTTQNGLKLVTQEDFEIIKLVLEHRHKVDAKE